VTATGAHARAIAADREWSAGCALSALKDLFPYERPAASTSHPNWIEIRGVEQTEERQRL
jgi:hypothetical protein